MIFFVIFGHLIEPLIADNPQMKIIWIWIYTFHMPVFVMVAGLLSKSEYRPEFWRKLTKSIIVPFAVFTLIYEIFHVIMFFKPSQYGQHFQPYWLLWFLLSLFIWRALLPLILKLKYPILITVAISILAGYFEPIGRGFGLSRTLYFFPFFLLGHTLLPKFIHRIQNNTFPKIILWAGFILSLFIAFNMQDVSEKWMLGSQSYTAIGFDTPLAGLIRLAIYVLSALLSLIIFGLVPNKEFSFTARGNNSLYIYIWHGFFVKTLLSGGLIILIGKLSFYPALGVFVALTGALLYILSSDRFNIFTQRYLLKPITKYLD